MKASSCLLASVVLLSAAQLHAASLVYHFTFDDTPDSTGSINGVNLNNSGTAGNANLAQDISGYMNYTTTPETTWGGTGRSFVSNSGTFKISNASGIGVSFDSGFTIGMQICLPSTVAAWRDFFQIGQTANNIRLETTGAAFPYGTAAYGNGALNSYGGIAPASASFAANAWHHVAFSYENIGGGQGQFTFWFDGVNVGSKTGTAITGNVTDTWIGWGSNGKVATARFDDVAIFDSALTSEQMALMATGAINVIPEPSTYAFAGIVSAGIALVALRRRKRS